MTQPNRNLNEKRLFPRTQANCPVLYRNKTTAKWLIGKLIDFSAVGMAMTCESKLAENSIVEFQFRPGSKKSVPQLHGRARVLRCTKNDDGTYLISCQLVKIFNPRK